MVHWKLRVVYDRKPKTFSIVVMVSQCQNCHRTLLNAVSHVSIVSPWRSITWEQESVVQNGSTTPKSRLLPKLYYNNKGQTFFSHILFHLWWFSSISFLTNRFFQGNEFEGCWNGDGLSEIIIPIRGVRW